MQLTVVVNNHYVEPDPHTSLVFIRGLKEIVCPVQQRRAFLCAIIQSRVPSKWTVAKDVWLDFEEMRSVAGLADEI